MNESLKDIKEEIASLLNDYGTPSPKSAANDVYRLFLTKQIELLKSFCNMKSNLGWLKANRILEELEAELNSLQ